MNRNFDSRLIVFEGVDKAGKTTQSQMLFEYLKSIYEPNKLSLYSFPDYKSNTGKEIRAYLDGKIDRFANEWLHLLYAANRYEWKKDIENNIAKGKTIILNRYFESNIVYGYSRGIDALWLSNLDRLMPKPDITIILDVPIIESSNRNNKPDKNESNISYMEIVRKNFLKFSEEYDWKIVDGTGSREEVHKRVLAVLDHLL